MALAKSSSPSSATAGAEVADVAGLPTGAAYRLDAEFFDVEDLDGVGESALGSGNLNHLILQAELANGLGDPTALTADALLDEASSVDLATAGAARPVTNAEATFEGRLLDSGQEDALPSDGAPADQRGFGQPTELAMLIGGSSAAELGAGSSASGFFHAAGGTFGDGADAAALVSDQAVSPAEPGATPADPPPGDGPLDPIGGLDVVTPLVDPVLDAAGEIVDSLTETVGEVVETVGTVATSVLDTADQLVTVLTGTIEGTTGALGNVEDSLLGLTDGVVGGLAGVADGATETLTSVTGAVGGVAGSGLGLAGGVVSGATQTVGSVAGVADAAAGSVLGAVGTIAAGLTDTVGASADGVGQTVQDTIDAVLGEVNDVPAALAGLVASGAGGIGDAVDGLAGAAAGVGATVQDSLASVVGTVEVAVEGATGQVTAAVDGATEEVAAHVEDVTAAVQGTLTPVAEVVETTLDGAIGQVTASVEDAIEVTGALGDGLGGPGALTDALLADDGTPGDDQDLSVALVVDLGDGEQAGSDAEVNLDAVEELAGDIDLAVEIGTDAPAEAAATLGGAAEVLTGVVDSVAAGLGESAESIAEESLEQMLGDIEVELAALGDDALGDGGLLTDSDASGLDGSTPTEVIGDLIPDRSFLGGDSIDDSSGTGDGLPEPDGVAAEGLGMLLDLQIDQSLGSGLFG